MLQLPQGFEILVSRNYVVIIGDIATASCKKLEGEPAKPFFERVFRANSNIIRDALANNPVAVPIYGVPVGGSFTVRDATQPIVVYSLFDAPEVTIEPQPRPL